MSRSTRVLARELPSKPHEASNTSTRIVHSKSFIWTSNLQTFCLTTPAGPKLETFGLLRLLDCEEGFTKMTQRQGGTLGHNIPPECGQQDTTVAENTDV